MFYKILNRYIIIIIIIIIFMSILNVQVSTCI